MACVPNRVRTLKAVCCVRYKLCDCIPAATSERRRVRLFSQQAEFESRPYWFTEMSLADSIRLGECLVCSNLIHSERRNIYSFLWEGMMSAQVRRDFLQGGGFCARHFGIAKHIEDDCWPAGGIGIAILCENLVTRAIAELPPEADLIRAEPMNPFHRKRDIHVPPAGSGCMFCRDWMKREESLIDTLEYLKNKPTWSEKLERSPLCVHHALLALCIWREPEDKLQVRSAIEARLRELQGDLNEFIRKHDWHHRDEALGQEKDAVERAMQLLTGLERQFPLYRTGSEGGKNNGTRER
jgi:hypothetical protein